MVFMRKNAEHSIVVGMSGGVDSSVAAALLLRQAYAVIGLTMKTYDFDHVGGNIGNEASCCGLDAFNDARMVAVQLGIPHYIVDFTAEFGRDVIDNFVDEYLRGRTPNPCIICNRKIKWGALLEKAKSLGADKIATGHYARIRYDASRGRYLLIRGRSHEKDQSYALWGLSQDALSRTVFPLGELSKPEVRSLATEFGLKTARKGESFEICFVADDNYRRFLKERVPGLEQRVSAGNLVRDGKVVGTHSGYPFYTIGQREGLGAHGERVYVTGVDAVNNTIFIDRNAALFHRTVIATQVNFIGIERLKEKRAVTAQVRYNDVDTPAIISPLEGGAVNVEFKEPKRAIAPGQSVVFFDGEEVLGGGVIEGVEGLTI